MANPPFVRLDVSKVSVKRFQQRMRREVAAISIATDSEAIGRVIIGRIRHRMKFGQNLEGGKQPAIADGTIDWRKWAIKNPTKAGYGGGISEKSGNPLYFSGRLRDSIQRAETGQSFFTNTGFGFAVSSSDPYAAKHHFGGRGGKGVKEPSRPFVGVGKGDAVAVKKDMLKRYAVARLAFNKLG